MPEDAQSHANRETIGVDAAVRVSQRDPSDQTAFIPALRFHALTGLFDPIMRLVMRDEQLRQLTLSFLRPEPAERVLDIGCGTGSLAVRLKQEHPRALVVGYDVDPTALAIAERKARAAQVSVSWRRGPADDPPFPDQSFDLVTSSLLLHHLLPSGKRSALAAAWRLLKPGGRFVLVDFSRPEGRLRSLAFAFVRALDGRRETEDHARGRIPAFVEEAGFADVAERLRLNTAVGTIGFITARKPRSGWAP
ncbi:MAG: class I SAM-dependent methyltransferase [Thermoanaerobaculia bacterium]